MNNPTSSKTASILSTQAILAVVDGAASAEYYCDTLGFTMVKPPEGAGIGWHIVERDGFRIWLGELTGTYTPISECSDHSWFAYAVVDDIEALYEEVTERGATLWHPLASKAWGMREFAVMTPDGHRIVFGQQI